MHFPTVKTIQTHKLIIQLYTLWSKTDQETKDLSDSGVKLRHNICAVPGAPPSSSGLEEAQ